MICERFMKQINAHLLGNMLEIDNYPLILAIMGRPGMGKTWQLRNYLETLDYQLFSVNSADLESEIAGAPAKLLKEQYVKASVNIARKKLSAIVVDDIDTTVGEWENNTGTVNHQGILAFLMHIADNPCYIENIGVLNRVPVFITGNKFELLYEPLRRPGRTVRFDWEPDEKEKTDMLMSIFRFDHIRQAELLVNSYPDQPISFFSSLYATKNMEYLSEIADREVFNRILVNADYRKQLLQHYRKGLRNINWLESAASQVRKENK